MKRPLEIHAMIERIEREVSANEEGSMRGALIMALEWVQDGGASTSQGLEDYLDEEVEG